MSARNEAAVPPEHVRDAADHVPIVRSRLASRVRWHMRLKPRRLFRGRPEKVMSVQGLLSQSLNQEPLTSATFLWAGP